MRTNSIIWDSFCTLSEITEWFQDPLDRDTFYGIRIVISKNVNWVNPFYVFKKVLVNVNY
jgi:hypothetical protein